MIQLERHERILEHLNTHRFIGAEQAHALIGASPATIRRDFNDLADKGLAQRTRGGLRRLDQVEDGALPYAFRAARYSAEKAAIARRAVSLLQPGDSVFVDGGTTTYALSRYIPTFPLTVITNSLRLASALGERASQLPDLRVLLSGGALHPEAGLLVGPQAVRTLSEYHADWAFVSPGGVDRGGIYNTNEDAAASERVMIRNARQTAVLADPGKLGKTSLCRIVGLDAVQRLITTAPGAASDLLDSLEEGGVEIEVVMGDG
ncbi:MAG: DeoR/GlpR transcriptional regulator [Candidatus Hydrogenedentes bacterium]|nr:DeoR/GlpR transcriptional regulator [Candidatus Hydrogenedentota bacterium]